MASHVNEENSIGEEEVSLAETKSAAAEIIHDKTEVVIEIGPGDLPPPKKRGRPRKINTGAEGMINTESEVKILPKKRARMYKEDDEWTSPTVPVRGREAVITRTRTGRTPRRSIYGDDFISPFDTKTIRAELDKATKTASSSGEPLKRGRGRPPLKKVPAPLIQQDAKQMQPPSEIIVIETVQALEETEVAVETVQTPMETVTVEIIKASEAHDTEGTQTLMVEVVSSSQAEEAAPSQSQTQSVEAAPSHMQIAKDAPIQPQEIPPEVVVTPKKRRGRPPKRKEPEPDTNNELVDPDADLLEDVDQGAMEMEEEVTAEEQEQLDMLEINGENDFTDSNETEKEVLEALLAQDVGEEGLPVDPARSVRHPSAVAGLNDLLPDRCCSESDEPNCNCGLFHCPLCTVEYFKPVNYARVILKHLSIHEKYGVRFLDVICCPCRLDCQEMRMSHFHCPACGIVKLTKTTFQKHLDKHGDVMFILDPQWKTRQKQAASSPKVTPKRTPPAPPVLDEPVLSNVTAVLTTEFLEHIGAMENTESFLKEKLAMEKVFVTKVSDQWIIHGQWEHIQKAYSRLKKLHKEAKIQKLKGRRSNESEEAQHAASGQHTVSVLGQTLVIPKQEVTKDSPESLVVDSGLEPDNQELKEGDPDYKPKPRARRSKDEIKALGIKLKCRTCGLIKHSKDALYRHIWRCHKEKIHECSKCGRSYGQRSDMVRHQEACKGRKASIPEPEGDGPYKCDLCDKLLMTRETLKAHHKYIHTDTGACVCHLCGKNFRAPRYLKSHLVRHSDVRNYVCGVCGKSFKERGTLKEHLGTHKDPSEREKKFKCQLCPKTYFRHAALLDHMNFHAGRRPYSCVDCGKTFVGRCALQKHQLSHIERKSFDCDRCGKCFKFRHKLESHFVTHTGFSKHVCSICGKCFTTSTTLRKHNCKGSLPVDKLMLQNQNTPPIDTGKQTLQLYMCSLCNLTFTEWTEVAGHMLLHNEVGDGGVDNGSEGTVQIELQSQDLINLADAAAASASLAASGDASQEDMQSVINAIAQVQRMENADGELDDDVTTETQQALAQIQYNQIQIQDSNILNVIQDGQDEPRQVTIHLEDNEQYQIVQEQLAANPEQFQIIQENAGEERGQFQLIQGTSDDSQGQYQVIQDADAEGTFNYQVIQGDGVNQRYRIIQGEPGSQGQFQIIQSETSGEFQVIRGDPLDQGSFQISQGGEDQGQYQVIQETQQDGDFDVLQEGSDENQFQVVPGSEGGEGTVTITAPQTSEHSELSCNIGDMPLEHVEQLTAVTHIAMDPANHQECMVETELVEGGNGDPIYDEMQGEVLDSASVVVMSEVQQGTFQ